MLPETLKGKVRISRWHGADKTGHHTGIIISLTDELSRSQCVEIHLSVEALGECLTQSEQPCEFEWRPDVVGKVAENKEEIVPFNFTEKSKEKMDKAVAPFEVDGWFARRDDMVNHHRRVGNDQQRVTFFRHVEPNT